MGVGQGPLNNQEMSTETIIVAELGVTVQLASYAPDGHTAEHHVILHVEPRGELFEGQFDRIYRAEQALLAMVQFRGASTIFKRY